MDILKNNLVVGVGVVLAAAVLAPALIPAIGGVGRPLAKSLLKSGLRLYEKGREAVAIAGESMEDMLAEIRAEDAMDQTVRDASAAAKASQPGPAEPAPPTYPGNGAAAGAPQDLAGTARVQEGMGGR